MRPLEGGSMRNFPMHEERESLCLGPGDEDEDEDDDDMNSGQLHEADIDELYGTGDAADEFEMDS